MDDARAASVTLSGPFWSRVWIGGAAECWPWSGALTPAGYGQWSAGGGHALTHRLAAVLAGLVAVDDLPLVRVRACRQLRSCCNPAHLAVEVRRPR